MTSEDSGSCGTAVPAANPASFECGSAPCATGATNVCCRRSASFACGSGTAGCDDTVVDIQCDGPSDCGGLACCLGGTVTGTCPASAGTQVLLVCNAAVNCTGTGKYVTCNTTCTGAKTCTPTLLPTGKLVGVCL